MTNPLFTIISPNLYYTGGIGLSVEAPLSIYPGTTLLTGANGSGKTLFARIMEKGWNFRTNSIKSSNGRKPSIRYIGFNDIHSWAGHKVEYYQQRYEASMNDEIPTVADLMGNQLKNLLFIKLSGRLQLPDIGEKKINFLSSGELRKLLIINSLLDNTELLIIDNPYIGLDVESRKALNECLAQLRDEGSSMILIAPDDADAPQIIDNRLFASELHISTRQPATSATAPYEPFGFQKVENALPPDSSELLVMRNCRVSYGNLTVIPDINWIVKEGERWSLSGPNGSGKSTLLSFVCADNPKSYCTDIQLFGRKRGSGESIWEIKRNIGYVSPEMQLHFHGSGTVEHILANGMNDTVGLYLSPTEQQIEDAGKWLRHFRIEHLAKMNFANLSSGERQLVLIARAMIKEPRLLILDEPMHALDHGKRLLVENTLNEFLSSRPDAAFIMVTHKADELPVSINRHLNLKRNAT